MTPVNPVNTTSPRRYQIGDVIPGHGLVIDIALTAYHISTPSELYWVPFYGPNGVDPVDAVTPLVVLR